MFRPLQIVFGIAALALGLAGCVPYSPSAPTVPPVVQNPAVSNPLPHALKDVTDTRIYYPKAIFVANAVEGLPMDAVQGQPYSFRVVGDLTMRNVTRSVTTVNWSKFLMDERL